MPTYLLKTCEYCSKDFNVISRNKNQKFCSTECSQASKRKKVKLVNCLHCGNILGLRQYKFCCQSCAASYNNIGIQRHGKSLDEKSHPCLNCGMVIYTKSPCCSVKCSRIIKANKFTPEEWRTKKLISDRIAQRVYQAKKLRVIDPTANREKIKAFYDGCPPGYEVDHYIPLTRGGKHHENNLQYLTADENKRKGNKLPTEYQVRED